jgi:hypothetical protein
MFGVFSWIRSQAKNAVLAGVADAVDELENVESPEFDVEAWRKRLAEVSQPKQLPAKEEEPEPRGGRGKGK